MTALQREIWWQQRLAGCAQASFWALHTDHLLHLLSCCLQTEMLLTAQKQWRSVVLRQQAAVVWLPVSWLECWLVYDWQA